MSDQPRGVVSMREVLGGDLQFSFFFDLVEKKSLIVKLPSVGKMARNVSERENGTEEANQSCAKSYTTQVSEIGHSL